MGGDASSADGFAAEVCAARIGGCCADAEGGIVSLMLVLMLVLLWQWVVMWMKMLFCASCWCGRRVEELFEAGGRTVIAAIVLCEVERPKVALETRGRGVVVVVGHVAPAPSLCAEDTVRCVRCAQ